MKNILHNIAGLICFSLTFGVSLHAYSYFTIMTATRNIAVIGGGAAGFFAAITAKSMAKDANVTIYEKTGKLLAKVGVSGGGRCNLTNSFAHINDLRQAYPRGHQLMKRLFKSFRGEDAYRWFEAHGVELVTQDDGCVFPKSQDSQSVIDCLVGTARQLGVNIVLHHALVALKPLEDGRLKVDFKDQKSLCFDKVIVTTGGSPRLQGLQTHALLGHEIAHPVPSLFTFNIADSAFTQLMGAVVDPVTLSIPATKFKSTGALLITHWGMSGPATLKLSSHGARFLYENNYQTKVAINWVNQSNATIVEQCLMEIAIKNPKKQLSSLRPFDLPSRVWLYLLGRSALDTDKRWDELGRKGLNKLIETLTNDTHIISGKGSFKEEFVTCGGISLQSIQANTLESKACPNLYFAGEVLDVDGITGGFNLQAAWTTGFTAGKSAAEQLSSPI